jgi:hypothetical protein
LNLLSDFPDIKVFLNMRWKPVRDMRALSLLGRSLGSLAGSSRLIRIYSTGISLWLFSLILIKVLDDDLYVSNVHCAVVVNVCIRFQS